jgi:hypothetical protein
MGMLILVLLVIIGVAALCSYLLAAAVYRSQVKKGTDIAGAKSTRAVIFIFSTLFITAAIIYLLVSNISLSRG